MGRAKSSPELRLRAGEGSILEIGQGNCAGAHVGADDTADGGDGSLGIAEHLGAFCQEGLQIVIIQTAVGGAHGLTEVDAAGLGNQIPQLLVRSLGATGLTHVLHHTVLDGDDGLNVQHGAHHGGGGADAAALLQILQGIQTGVDADIVLDLVQALGDGGGIQTLVCQSDAVLEQQALADGGGHGIHHKDLALEFLGGDAGGLVGAGELGGQGDDHGGVTIVDDLLHSLLPGGGSDLAGGGVLLLAGGQHFVELLVAQVHGIGEFLLAEADGQRDMNNGQLLAFTGQHVGCGINDELDSHIWAPFRCCV